MLSSAVYCSYSDFCRQRKRHVHSRAEVRSLLPGERSDMLAGINAHRNFRCMNCDQKVKQSLFRPGQALGVSGG